MDRDQKIKRLNELKQQASKLKQEVEFYNAMQLALKLVCSSPLF